jgi:hypothetical protein
MFHTHTKQLAELWFEAGLSLNLPCDPQFEVTLVARPLHTPVAQKLCRYERVYSCSREESVFVIEHYFLSKPLLLLEEHFAVRPGKEVSDKTHGLIKFWDS